MNTMQKTIIAILVLAVFSAVIFFFIIQPAIMDIKTFNERIQMERAALENKYDSRRNIKNIIADLKYASDGLLPLEQKMIVQKGGEVGFVSNLESIAKTNNLAQKIKITPVIGEKGNEKMFAAKQNISIILSGDYLSILKYISELEKTDFYVILTSVNISSGDSGEAAAPENIKVYLEGYVYFSI